MHMTVISGAEPRRHGSAAERDEVVLASLTPRGSDCGGFGAVLFLARESGGRRLDDTCFVHFFQRKAAF